MIRRCRRAALDRPVSSPFCCIIFEEARLPFPNTVYMPVLNWIGKEAVVKHHKEVPFRLIEPVEELSCPPPYEGGVAAVLR